MTVGDLRISYTTMASPLQLSILSTYVGSMVIGTVLMFTGYTDAGWGVLGGFSLAAVVSSAGYLSLEARQLWLARAAAAKSVTGTSAAAPTDATPAAPAAPAAPATATA
jgi:hypothetical protein